MSKIKLSIATTLLAAFPALAHHQFSSEFDSKTPVTLSGTIQNVSWSGPHVIFTLNADGNQTWSLEGASPGTLSQRGYNQDLFKTGSRVTFQTYKAIGAAMKGSARAVTLPDGRTISVSDPSEDGGPAPTGLTSQAPTLPQTGSDLPGLILVGILAAAGAVLIARRPGKIY